MIDRAFYYYEQSVIKRFLHRRTLLRDQIMQTPQDALNFAREQLRDRYVGAIDSVEAATADLRIKRAIEKQWHRTAYYEMHPRAIDSVEAATESLRAKRAHAKRRLTLTPRDFLSIKEVTNDFTSAMQN